jgi:sugar (pentulose or hexulose) kinase
MEISVYAGSIMTAGGNLAWAASTGYPGSVSMKQIDSLVKLERAGCGGLLYLPYLNGTSFLLHHLLCTNPIGRM